MCLENDGNSVVLHYVCTTITPSNSYNHITSSCYNALNQVQVMTRELVARERSCMGSEHGHWWNMMTYKQDHQLSRESLQILSRFFESDNHPLWGRVTHICVGKLTIIGSDNGLSPERRQAIIWTNAGILLIGPLGTNFSEILVAIQTFSLKKIRLKMPSAKCCSFRLGLNVLTFEKESRFALNKNIYIYIQTANGPQDGWNLVLSDFVDSVLCMLCYPYLM